MGYGNETYGIFGDIRYQAPEVLKGKAYDFRADLWSYGVILFFMLSGGVYPFDYKPEDLSKENKSKGRRPPIPFERNEVCKEAVRTELEKRIIDEDNLPQLDLILKNGYSIAAHDIVKKLLQKEPSQRIHKMSMVLNYGWWKVSLDKPMRIDCSDNLNES